MLAGHTRAEKITAGDKAAQPRAGTGNGCSKPPRTVKCLSGTSPLHTFVIHLQAGGNGQPFTGHWNNRQRMDDGKPTSPADQVRGTVGGTLALLTGTRLEP